MGTIQYIPSILIVFVMLSHYSEAKMEVIRVTPFIIY